MKADYTFITYWLALVISFYLLCLQVYWIWRMKVRHLPVHAMFWYTFTMVIGVFFSSIILCIVRYYYYMDPTCRDEMITGFLWTIRLWPIVIGMLGMALHGTCRTFKHDPKERQ